MAKIQVVELDKNCNNFGIHQFDITSNKQGIVHVMGPELGYTLPGMTIVCGDSHTSTHGAFGCLAMGIGTSEVEHVLATQCLKITKLNMQINFNGSLQKGVTSKDIVLHLIKLIGTAGGTGHAIEFSGSEYIKSASMESRMTICNMAIEAGAKVGLVEVDATTLDYVKKHSNLSDSIFSQAYEYWETLKSDSDANFDQTLNIDVSKIKPQVTWGTSPEMTIDFDAEIPSQEDVDESNHENLLLTKALHGSRWIKVSARFKF